MDDFIGGNNYNQTEDQIKTKKIMKIVAIILVILLFVCIGLVVFMYYIQATQLKITVNGVVNAKLENVLVFDESGKVYIPIRAFSEYVGYTSSNGGYKQYTEDTTKCYVQSQNEVATFELNSNKIYKILLDGNNNYEYYEIDEPVKTINGQLYTTIEGAKIAFNISMSYNQEKNQVTIFTLPYLVTYYTAQFKNAAISEENNFSNQKALLYNMIIVKNEDKNYGVYGLDGKEILGTKYASIEFIENTQEFIVTTMERKVGIMSSNATTKISPEYDDIIQIDKDADLYLAINNNKQGVINSTGSIIIHLEYDQIGVDSTKYNNNEIQNPYLLYGECIPVKRNNKWGLFDKTGRQITQVIYDELGCSAGSGSSGDNNATNVLLIPKYNGIVIKEGNLYGLIDKEGKQLLPTVLESIYSTTTAGEVVYSMIYNEQVMNVITYIEQHVKPVDSLF